MMKSPSRSVWCCLLFAFLSVSHEPAKALEDVSLQLKWTRASQFADYQAAVEKGFCHEAGLNLCLLEAGPRIKHRDIVTDCNRQAAQLKRGIPCRIGAPCRRLRTDVEMVFEARRAGRNGMVVDAGVDDPPANLPG